MDSVVTSIVAAMPAWSGAEVAIEAMGGLTNTNYLVTVNGERFVVRVSGANCDLLGINREYEHEALATAQAAGIGPEVVRFFLTEGHLVTRLIDGRHWTVEEYRTFVNIKRLVAVVKRLHALTSAQATFSPFRRVESYAAIAKELEVSLPEDFDAFLSKMRAVEDEQSRDPSPWLGFCHNDLFAVNFLDDGNIRIVDWEFAGMGDIYFDLATLVYSFDEDGPLPPNLETYLLECYFGDASRAHRARLDGMKYMLLLFTAMWGVVQHIAQEKGLIPAPEDFDYLEYARNTFATVRENWL